MVQALAGLGGVRTVLEVGCNSGPLLRCLQAAGYVACGVDLNASAVALARASGLTAVVGAVPGFLARLDRGGVDVVVSSYCLSYTAPPDLPGLLAECLRVARVGLVLVEPMVATGQASAEVISQSRQYIEWRHDYVEAIEAARQQLGGDQMLETVVTPKHSPDNDLNGVLVARWV